MVNATDAKDIALYFIGAKSLPLTKPNIVKNITIAKKLLTLGFPKESIIMAIDLNIDKMYSLGFIEYVIEEVHNAMVEKAKEDLIREHKARMESTNIIYSEGGENEPNRNKEKIERLNRTRKKVDNSMFKK